LLASPRWQGWLADRIDSQVVPQQRGLAQPQMGSMKSFLAPVLITIRKASTLVIIKLPPAVVLVSLAAATVLLYLGWRP
jgi:hypothetical protein